TAQLNTVSIIVGVHTKGCRAEGGLNATDNRLMFAGDNTAGLLLLNDFLGEIGATEDADAMGRQLLLKDLAHQSKAFRLNALGSTDNDGIRFEIRPHQPGNVPE